MDILITVSLLLLLHIIFNLCKSIFYGRNRCCYILHYECYKPTDDKKTDIENGMKIVRRNKNLGSQEHKFVLRTLIRSGIGEESYSPRNVIDGREEFPTLGDSLLELDDAIFNTLDKLFLATGVSPAEIDVLVVSVSAFAPIPSITARIVNRYVMKENIKAFNLSGMGCSSSLAAIDVVQRLFKLYDNRLAIVVSTESLGSHWYPGKDKSMILSNCLFRLGGCSILLTNNKTMKHNAIMKLNCLVRSHIGEDDEAYKACFQAEDDQGYEGFILNKTLIKSASKALTLNLKLLEPKIFPVWIRIKTITSLKYKNFWSIKSRIKHFCIHPGGRAVIDQVGTTLQLSEYDLEPARMALHKFGNTASCGIWYALSYMQAKKRLKNGDEILMIGLGAGFECINSLWEVMRDLKEEENVWKDTIDLYPMIFEVTKAKMENKYMGQY
ncbi:3-ketoacyl-CoA synthase 19-like [Carica papaya]|uniref:3-ketoacyl-CoA synthase 19-like n=1 Tax=Carica papaya TaxID=3649 RepID=UPI000B8C7790|nr:3-ketoacyl-CoA synthase 19-like [Carica papaya]